MNPVVAAAALAGVLAIVAGATGSSEGAVANDPDAAPDLELARQLTRDRAWTPEVFGRIVDNVIAAAAREGVELRKLEGVRAPQKQAEYYSRGRNAAELAAAAAKLTARGQPWLAGLMAGQVPQPDRARNTGALPGDGWHAFGLARDLVWYVDGKPEWSLYRNGGRNGYAVLGRISQAHGLKWGGTWKSVDAGHVQAYPDNVSPAQVFGGYAAIDRELRSEFA